MCCCICFFVLPFSLSSSALATAARSRPATRTTRRSGARRCVRASRVHHLVGIPSRTSCIRSRLVDHHVRLFASTRSRGLHLSSLPAPSLRPPSTQRSPCFVVDSLLLMMCLLNNPTRLSFIIWRSVGAGTTPSSSGTAPACATSTAPGIRPSSAADSTPSPCTTWRTQPHQTRETQSQPTIPRPLRTTTTWGAMRTTRTTACWTAPRRHRAA